MTFQCKKNELRELHEHFAQRHPVRPGVTPLGPVRNLSRPTPFETRLLDTWHKQAWHHRSEVAYNSLKPRFSTTNCHCGE